MRASRSFALALALAVGTPATMTLAATEAHAQAPPSTDHKLAAARKLFAEALKEEEDKKFDSALTKFRQVQQVKNTLAVRYRIASCLEGLGHLREAEREFRAIVDERAEKNDEADVQASAKDRALAIAHRLPHMTLHLSPRAPVDAQVTLDGQPLVGGALRGEPIPIDPGEHEIHATASGVPDFASRISVAEAGSVSIDLPLDPPAQTTSPKKDPPPPPVAPPEPPRTLGIVLVSVGAVLAAASIVTVVLRARDIDELNSSCPRGVCPVTRQSELTSTRSRALTEGPLALVLAGAAAVSGGAGLYFLLAPSTSPAEATKTGTTAALGWRGTF